MIRDLMATVERVKLAVEQRAEQQRIAEELHEIYSMQIAVTPHDQVLVGAA
jgi:hypothetical protein